VALFNVPQLPAPPLPPENITTEQDRQTQMHYEQWLNHQNQIVTSQLKYYETEVSKLRKMRKVSHFRFLCWVGGETEFLETQGKMGSL
jgi:histone-lysine N-methyltransferase MLL3